MAIRITSEKTSFDAGRCQPIMAAISFGSFGDILALVQVASSVCAAISKTGTVARDLDAAKRELETFISICTSIERVIKSDSPIHQDDVDNFETVMTSCQECLVSFGKYLSRFDDRRTVVRFARRTQYSLSRKEEIRRFESRMRGFVAMLGIMQTRYCSQELTMHISRSLDEPYDQRPMKFQDALGRRYPVPLEVCGTFEVSFP